MALARRASRASPRWRLGGSRHIGAQNLCAPAAGCTCSSNLNIIQSNVISFAGCRAAATGFSFRPPRVARAPSTTTHTHTHTYRRARQLVLLIVCGAVMLGLWGGRGMGRTNVYNVRRSPYMLGLTKIAWVFFNGMATCQ